MTKQIAETIFNIIKTIISISLVISAVVIILPCIVFIDERVTISEMYKMVVTLALIISALFFCLYIPAKMNNWQMPAGINKLLTRLYGESNEDNQRDTEQPK